MSDPFARALAARRKVIDSSQETVLPISSGVRSTTASSSSSKSSSTSPGNDLVKLAFGSSAHGLHSEDVSEQSSESRNSEWVLYYSPEGYPYYYNDVTGESQWAETDNNSGYSFTDESSSTFQQNRVSLNDKIERPKSDMLGVGEGDGDGDNSFENNNETTDNSDDTTSSSESSESESESDEDSLDDSAEDGDDEEAGRGGILLSRALEEKFQQFLETQDGIEILEQEQKAIARRLELRVAKRARIAETARLRELNRKGKKSKKRGIAGAIDTWITTLQSSVVSLVAIAKTSISSIAVAGRPPSSGQGSGMPPPHSNKTSKSGDGGSIKKWSDLGPVKPERSIDYTVRNPRDDDDDDDDSDSISSSDSDVREISAPLVPTWVSWSGLSSSLQRYVASLSGTIVSRSKESAASKRRRPIGTDLSSTIGASATKSLESVTAQGYKAAAWVAEFGIYGACLVGSALWSQVSVVVVRLLDGASAATTAATPATQGMLHSPKPPSSPPKTRFVLRPEGNPAAPSDPTLQNQV